MNYYYNNLNQLIRVEHQGHVEDYQYDKRGNIVKKFIDGAVDMLYNFDERNLLSHVETSEGKEMKYYYNGLGKRIGQEGTDGRIDDIIDLTKDYNNLLMRRDNGRIQSCTWDYGVVSTSDTSGANYYLNDELGSPMRIVDNFGKPKAAYSFSEFGSVRERRGSYAQPFGYTGYQYDNTSSEDL